MRVAVVQVRKVRMAVHHRGMPVRVDMRFASWVIGPMRVPMVLVMYMGMFVHRRLVFMLMLVVFDQMQPKADAHQHGGGNEASGEGFAEQRQGEHGANERRR